MTEAAHAEFVARRRFGSLDGLRAVSILGVVWHHCGHHGGSWKLLERGAEGVTLFFAISGFLITTLLLRERERFGSISLPQFYARRTLRIFPLYYAVLLCFLAVGLVAGRDSFFGKRFFPYLPLYLTYTSNWASDRSTPFGYSWSLACEEQFYLLWPPMLVWLGVRGATGALVALLAANQAAELGFLDSILPKPLVFLLTTLQPAIALGVLLAIALHSKRGHAILARAIGSPWTAPVAFAVMIAVLSAPWDVHRYMLVDAAMALVVAACVIPPSHALSRPLGLWPVVRIGIVSYGMYLFHLPLITAMRRVVSPAPAAMFLLAVLVTWAVAELSFATFERFFLRWKRRFERV
jgi:peptidoglycan/LPS O-acetylase OafA/YrhL